MKQAVFGQARKPTPAEKVAWGEADEWWPYIAQKKDDGWRWWAIDRVSWVGRWGIVAPQRPPAAYRKFASNFWPPYGKIFAG